MKWNVANTFRKQKKTPLVTGSPPSRHGSASHATVAGRLCPEGVFFSLRRLFLDQDVFSDDFHF
ncbi:hypothetical protein EB820_08835 [Brevibacillus agri]|uniref:Uncharacterized protein n=1 Tax=Brevibacillus agri TaxID=51101 RepID=A0A3M8AZZ6_9BACL|nr:hypothetical protein [Brevibacillus agri]QAV13911.1 hypothetical protein BA6348_14765 [Brevibacillus agri]RNB56748.1 hypothetical protein EB820_08835 [Brevibacillus agri]